MGLRGAPRAPIANRPSAAATSAQIPTYIRCVYNTACERDPMKKPPTKKQTQKQPRRVIPAFATEAEESQWWYDNRVNHGKQMLDAVKGGEARVLTKEKLRDRITASRKTPAPVVALRIPEADLALARRQAEKKGLPYQTYIKSLLHETLTAREKRKVGW